MKSKRAEGHHENYNVFRWYASGLGRYTQPDPLGIRGGLNIFSYAYENPTIAIDALGLAASYRAGPTHHQPLRFPGQELDDSAAGAERSYNVFRWYRSGLGRYTQADPMGIYDSVNVYGYVDQNPLDSVDPLGLTKIYGNWCGPNWTGGYNKPWNSLTQQQRKKVLPPVDALDEACKDHDICYGDCGVKYPCDPLARSYCLRSCDDDLVARARNFGGRWGHAIAAAINRPGPVGGPRDPGPNAANCPQSCPKALPVPTSPPAPTNCAVVNGRKVCAGTGM